MKVYLCRIAVFAVLLSFFVPIKCFSSEGDVIAYWKFNEGKGTIVKDSSGNGHDGKIKGNAIKWVKGKKGKALYFPKSKKKYQDSLTVPNAPELNLTPPFTIEAWVKPALKAKRQSILQKTTESGLENKTGWRFLFYYRGLNFTCWNGKNKKASIVRGNSLEHCIKVNVWQHVVVVCDDKLIKLYINGEEVKRIEKTKSIMIKPNKRCLSIGSYAGGYTASFEGCLDEIIITKRAKSALEILKIFKNI